jgi:hypothetical protein
MLDSFKLNLLHPLGMKNGVKHHFIGFSEKAHRPPEHLIMLRFQVSHKVLTGIPFFKKKDSLSVLDILAEIATPASLLNFYGTGQ